MSTPLTSLNFAAFSLGGSDMLGLLKTFSFTAVNEQVDAAGLADRYTSYQTVKQEQTADFTVFMPLSGGGRATNLDITLWSIGGTAYLGSVRQGVIRITTIDRDRSGIADAFQLPNATRTQVEVVVSKLVIVSTPFISTLMTGVISSFDVTAAITFGGVAFSCPMNLKSARHTVDREELQMEEVVMTLTGTPTGPSDSSLMGNILLGTSLVTLSADTGGGVYGMGSGQSALIRKLNTVFKDAALIEQSGTLAIQGGATWSA